MLPGLFIPPGATSVREVVLSYQGGSDATAGTTADYSAAPIGDASSDRLVVVVICSSDSNSIYNISSATIGGIAATIIQSSASSVARKVGIVYAFVPTGTTADIAVTYSEFITFKFRLEVHTITGLTPEALVVQSATSANSSATSRSVNVVVPAVPSVTIGGFVGPDYSSPLAWTGLDEEADVGVSIIMRTGAAAALESSTSAGKTVSCSHSGASGEVAIAVANFS